MLLKTVVIALLTGSSIASAIPNCSTSASNATASETGGAPAHFEIPHGCHKIDGHIACPKEQSINARARAPVPGKPKPATSSKPKPTTSSKPKPATSEKPQPATSSKPKPTTSEKPKPTTSSRPKPTTLEKIQSTTSGKPKSIASSEPTSSKPTSSKPTSSKPTSSKPTSSKPTSSKPTSSKPTSSKPTSSISSSGKSTSSTPTTGTPEPTEPADANCKRGFQGGQPSCNLPIVAPINQASIPASVTCVGTGNFDSTINHYNHAQILIGVNRGIQYAVLNKQATKAHYPHEFFNKEKLPVDPKCAGKTIQEFPIVPGGPFNVSASAKPKLAGLDRVLFTHPNKVNGDQEDSNNSEVFYCGIITHNGPRKDDIQPFHACT